MSIWLALGAFAIGVAAAAAQAVAGFGFALLAVPLFALLIGAKSGVASAAALGLVLTATIAWRERAHIDSRTASRAVLPALLGIPLGLLVIRSVSDRALSIVIGTVVLGFTALLATEQPIPAGRATVWLGGFLSGVLATSTGTNGPPLVIAFQATRMRPHVFRATLAIVFMIEGAIALLLFALADTTTRTSWLVALSGVPGAALGWWLGDHLFSRIDPRRFRIVILVMLASSAVVAIASALTR
ncbi:MAG: sulfite exporter TauE/SafE family protein [Actinomycetota bacterium]